MLSFLTQTTLPFSSVGTTREFDWIITFPEVGSCEWEAQEGEDIYV